jgi:Tfp pilus assembly protein PilF
MVLLAWGCAGSRPAPAPTVAPGEPLPRRERAFLLDPAANYPMLIDPGRQTEVSAAYLGLVEQGRRDETLSRARELLAVDPGFHPALVLAAQVDYLEGRLSEARDGLLAVVGELPGYAAAQLLLGRVHEALGDVVEAYRAYREVSRQSEAALHRGEELLPRTLEITANRVSESLSRGHLEAAEAELSRLTGWGPESTLTLEAAREVAAARGDASRELAALARLTERFPDRRDLAERRGELELAVGDPGAGVEIYQGLVARYPQDRALGEKLEVAKFRWRLALLPDRVKGLVERPELSRGGFAVLLYWLVPEVRYGKPAMARIASDILDHPQREEIARVINLGLMGVDSTLHRFAPETPVSRQQALEALLTLLRGSQEEGAACLDPGGLEPSAAAACAMAVRCALIADPADCLPGARLAGREAVELIRRALEVP